MHEFEVRYLVDNEILSLRIKAYNIIDATIETVSRLVMVGYAGGPISAKQLIVQVIKITD